MFRVPCQIQWPGSLECSRSFFIHFFYECCCWICCITIPTETIVCSVTSDQTAEAQHPSELIPAPFLFIWDSPSKLFLFWDSPSKLLLFWLSNSGLFIREGHIDIDGICSTWKCTAPKTKSAELYLHRIIALSTLYLNTTPSKHSYETYIVVSLSATIKLIFDLIMLRIPLQKMFFWAINDNTSIFQQTLQHFKTIIIQKLSSYSILS